MLTTLEALVRAESPTHDARAQEQVFALLSALLEDLDHRTHRLPGKHSGGLLLAIPRDRLRGQPAQLLLAHADTVWPHGTLDRMPFALDGDVVRGPGTYDCKAGLVQAIFALRALKAHGLVPPLTPVLLVNSDEETGSADSTRQVARMARAVRRTFVLEPSMGPEGRLKTSRKGVGHFTITVTGKAAHAGLDPDKGVSATVELAHVIQALHALNDPARGCTVNIGEITGGTRRNVIPAQATAEIDVRTWTHDDATRVEAAIHALRPTLPGATLDIRGGFFKPPMECTDASLALWNTAREAGERLGLALDHGAAGGASDGNTTARFCPTLDGLGAVGDGAHALHEHVRIDTLAERAALLALLLMAPSPDRHPG